MGKAAKAVKAARARAGARAASLGLATTTGRAPPTRMATAGAAVCARRLMGVPLAAVLPPLDACADRLMRLCVEDLFGEAPEAREATDVLKNDVKEAKEIITLLR